MKNQAKLQATTATIREVYYRSPIPETGIAVSRLTATASRSSSNRSAYTSSVMDALAWPSIRCTASTLAPALMAGEGRSVP